MRAGRLDRPLVFYRLIAQRQADSSSAEVPVEQCKGWGAVVKRDGRDTFAANQRGARQALLIETRFQAGISPRMLVKLEGTMYEIEDASPLDRNERLLLTCYAFEVDAAAD